MSSHSIRRVCGGLVSGVLLVLVGGCISSPVAEVPGNPTPQFGYVPFDPLPVQVNRAGITAPAGAKYDPVLSILPDETVRIAIAKFDSKLGITYGVAKADADAGSYRVTLDYMKFTTANFKLFQLPPATGSLERTYRLYDEQNDKGTPVIVPVYVGVGLRIVAEVTVYGGSVNLGSLFAIGAAAEARKLNGTLMVQSLGIGGQAISGALPMPSEINQTTITNAITALATIKSKLWDEGTSISPRVLGVYNTIGGDSNTVNGVIGMLLTAPPQLPLVNGASMKYAPKFLPADHEKDSEFNGFKLLMRDDEHGWKIVVPYENVIAKYPPDDPASVPRPEPKKPDNK